MGVKGRAEPPLLSSGSSGAKPPSATGASNKMPSLTEMAQGASIPRAKNGPSAKFSGIPSGGSALSPSVSRAKKFPYVDEVHEYWSSFRDSKITACPKCKVKDKENILELEYTNMMFGVHATYACLRCEVQWNARIGEDPDY